jgi:hypothetical protein
MTVAQQPMVAIVSWSKYVNGSPWEPPLDAGRAILSGYQRAPRPHNYESAAGPGGASHDWW